MPSFSADHISEHSSADLFDLVADIESYPQFLSFCKSAKILERHDSHIIVRLTLGYGLLHESFTSRVALDRKGGIIDAQLEEGPLESLHCKWSFIQKEEGCHIACALNFDFKHGLLARMVSPLLDHAAQRLVENFIARAEKLSACRRASAR